MFVSKEYYQNLIESNLCMQQTLELIAEDERKNEPVAETKTDSIAAILASSDAFGGKLGTAQIESVSELCRAFDLYGDGRKEGLAYIIATCYAECSLVPVREYRANINTPLRTVQDRYWHTGFMGRGLVQLTHERNYKKLGDFIGVNLVENPQLLITNVEISARVAVTGMVHGLFTSFKLSDFINDQETDFFNARKIVNSLDRAGEIAAKADRVLVGLEKY